MSSLDARQFVFGPGNAWCVLVSWMDGTSPTISDPRAFDVQQDLTLDFALTSKPMFGSNQFPVAIGIGEGKVTGKVRMGRLNPTSINSLVFGEPAGPVAGVKLMSISQAGSVPAATPYTLTPTVPGTGTWYKDWGVRYASTGLYFTPVASGPTIGQYSVAAGVYTFAAADEGAAVLLDFEYTLTTGSTLTVLSHLQGDIALSSVRYQGVYGGRNIGFLLPNVVGNKFSAATKQHDWLIPEMDFEAFADPSGNVCYLYFSSENS